MANRKRPISNPNKNLSILSEIAKQLRLVWLLFRDDTVPLWIKSILPASLLYLISPLDFLPDVVLGLGQLDDLGIILLGMTLFVKLCPPDIVEYYRRQLEYGDVDHDKIIDSTVRTVDEEQ